MASSSTAGTVEQLAKPEYNNWLALGHALTAVFCQGVRSFITKEIKTFHGNVSARVAGPCTCVRVPGRRPNEFHDINTCAWAQELEAHHHGNKPNWKQSDSTMWADPELGPWEIAKLFLPDLGGHADIKSTDDMDITGILNLMYWCNHFTIPLALINDVRDTRNDKWVHVPKLAVTDADKTVAFDSIENLLKDPQLAAVPDAQNALREIMNLRNVSDLKTVEAQVLANFRNVLDSLIQQSEITQKQLDQVKQLLEFVEKRLQILELLSFFSVTFRGLNSLLRKFVRSLKGTRKGISMLWIMMSLFLSFVILDEDTFIKDGKLKR